jgi:hypothetical protein
MAEAMLQNFESLNHMNARRMQSLTEGDFPANGSPRQKLTFALKYAALAPTEGNWQAWEFRMADTHLDLMAKNDPALEAVDPDGRECMIGCGMALVYLKLALKYFGCLGQVDLFPDLGDFALVARIHFGFYRERDTQEKFLFDALTQEHANASLMGNAQVSEMMLAALSHAAAGERGWLDFVQSEMSRQQILEITQADDQRPMNFDRSRIRAMNPVTARRTARWSRPLFAFAGRRLDSWNVTDEPSREAAVPEATLAVVKTKTDDKHGWLVAGQTMGRTILHAQALGLSWAFFDPVRRREARAALRVGVGHKGFAQVILRFGPLMADNMVQMVAPATATAIFR